jgi:hypothetical protein
VSLPAFTAQASLYRTSGRYHAAGIAAADAAPDGWIVPSYIPGAQTQRDCDKCLAPFALTRKVCLAKAAVMVAESCITSLFFGCGPAIALGYIQAAACEEGYIAGFGICNIPSADELDWDSPCCPKVCGVPTPGKAGSGCCDHGEACVGSDHPNARDGCCPVGQYCGGDCCAKGATCCGNQCCPEGWHCLEGGICSEFYSFTPPGSKPPTPPENNICLFGGEPCGKKCCLGGYVCCDDAEGPTCRQPPCVR